MNPFAALFRYTFFRFTLGMIFLGYTSATFLTAPDYINGEWLFQSRLWPYAMWKCVLMGAVSSILLAWALVTAREYANAPCYPT